MSRTVVRTTRLTAEEAAGLERIAGMRGVTASTMLQTLVAEEIERSPARPSVLLRAHRQEVLRIAAEMGFRNVRVFGSVARGDDRPGSDIDLIVDGGEVEGFDLYGLVPVLEDLLGVSVDVAIDGPEVPRAVLLEARTL